MNPAHSKSMPNYGTLEEWMPQIAVYLGIVSLGILIVYWIVNGRPDRPRHSRSRGRLVALAAIGGYLLGIWLRFIFNDREDAKVYWDEWPGAGALGAVIGILMGNLIGTWIYPKSCTAKRPPEDQPSPK